MKEQSSKAKTKQQESAWNYAKEYLNRILDMEDAVGHRIEMYMQRDKKQ